MGFPLAEDLPEGLIPLRQVRFCFLAQILFTEGNLLLLLNFFPRLKKTSFFLFIDLCVCLDDYLKGDFSVGESSGFNGLSGLQRLFLLNHEKVQKRIAALQKINHKTPT